MAANIVFHLGEQRILTKDQADHDEHDNPRNTPAGALIKIVRIIEGNAAAPYQVQCHETGGWFFMSEQELLDESRPIGNEPAKPFALRLEYLRGELRAERISLDEICELQSLAEHIEPGDVELLEAAGVPEFPE